MTARLQDVARIAGVAISTTSRYLNKSGFVSKKTGARIQAAIEELGYVPDLAAGTLVTKKSRLVAVLVPMLSQSIFNQTIEALIDALASDGYTAMLALTGPDETRMDEVVKTALARRPEAIILTGPLREGPVRERLRKANITIIETWGLPRQPIDVAVGLSHRHVGQAIARYLNERGYRRPFHLTTAATRSNLRREGFVEEWSRLRGTEVIEAEVENPSRFSQARSVFRQARAMANRPDVIICGSDGLAQGIAVEALAAGVAVPDELAIMGFGDLAIAAHMRPSLTTIAIDGERIGHEAANILRCRARGEDIPTNRIDVGFRIIERESA